MTRVLLAAAWVVAGLGALLAGLLAAVVAAAWVTERRGYYPIGGYSYDDAAEVEPDSARHRPAGPGKWAIPRPYPVTGPHTPPR